MINDLLKLKSCGSCGLNVKNAGVYLPDCVEGWKSLKNFRYMEKNHMHCKIVLCMQTISHTQQTIMFQMCEKWFTRTEESHTHDQIVSLV